MNEFYGDLAYSLEKPFDEAINEFYRKTFPGIVEIEFCEDMERQRRGIDKILHFKSGYEITIDEKKRKKDYGDILLELESVKEKGKKGWLLTCQCDYIAYIVTESKIVYFLPTLLLKKAWWDNKESWKARYPIKEAKNPGYTTVNIAIPTKTLLDAIITASVQNIV